MVISIHKSYFSDLTKTREMHQENWWNQSIFPVRCTRSMWQFGRKKTLSKWKVTQPHHRCGAMRQALQTNIGVCLPQAPFFAELINKPQLWWQLCIRIIDDLWRSVVDHILLKGPSPRPDNTGWHKKIDHIALCSWHNDRIQSKVLPLGLVTYWHVSKTHDGQSMALLWPLSRLIKHQNTMQPNTLAVSST